MLSKILHIKLLLVFAAVIFISCEKSGDDLVVEGDAVGTVSLSASYGGEDTSTRVSNNLWESSDFIGVSTSDESECNMCYMVDVNGAMTNIDDDYSINVVNSKSYYAYYPYDSSVGSDGIKSIDLTNQSKLDSDQFDQLDFMWSKQENIGAYQSLVYLLFKRQLVHLDVTLCIKDGTYNQMQGIKLDGVEMGGEFDIKSGLLISDGVKDSWNINVEKVDSYTVEVSGGDCNVTVVKAQAMVMPMSSGEIVFSYYDNNGHKYKCALTSGDLVAGNSYNYIITNDKCEGQYLSDITGGVVPVGDLWIFADSGAVTEAEFSTLRELLIEKGMINLDAVLLFPNLKVLPRGAFRGCDMLKRIYIPEATTVGNDAFAGCSTLKSIYAPKLEHISAKAFENCEALESIDDLESLYMIGERAFAGCTSISQITLPSLSHIGDETFSGCSTMKLFDASNLSWIGKRAFTGCDGLIELMVGEELLTSGVTNLEYGWVDSAKAQNIELIISATLPSGVSLEGDKMTYATGESDTFKSAYNQAWVLSSFSAYNMPSNDTWVIMDSSAQSSADFEGLNAALDTLSEPITLVFLFLENLPDSALSGAVNIESVYLPSVETIGANSLFAVSGLKSVDICSSGRGVESIGDGWIDGVDSEAIDLKIKVDSNSDLMVDCNRLAISSGASQYFHSINGCGFKLAQFEAIRYSSIPSPISNSWVITDNGDPAVSEFEDLIYVLKQRESSVAITFSNANSLPGGALRGASNLSEVIMPVATRLYYESLSSCEDLLRVDMPKVTTISNSVFAGSTSLQNVSLPSAMVVGSSLFKFSTNMRSLDLGSATYVTSYAWECFETMFNLNNVELTTCSEDEMTDDISISGNSLVFDVVDEYTQLVTYTFKQINCR